MHQFDVKNAFLHGLLDETVYCQQPIGFVDHTKSLYGLKQAPRARYTCFATYIRSLGFAPTSLDSTLFTLRRSDDCTFLLLFVDDSVLTASTTFLCHITDHLHKAFSMKYLRPLHFFLGVSVTRTPSGFFLSQQTYATELIEHAGMSSCKQASTPIDTRPKVSIAASTPIADATSNRSLVGALQCLTMTCPDIAYAV